MDHAPTSLASIDWNAFLSDADEFQSPEDTREPPPPTNRAFYPLLTQSGWRVQVVPYNPAWPGYFQQIQSHIHNLLRNASPPVEYTTIEHIGSTSIPGMWAKPNIDVTVVLPSRLALQAALEAFDWEVPSAPPFIRYTRIPNGGGIRGRESLKLYVPTNSYYATTTPERSVYLINDDASNPEGRIQIQSYRAFKRVMSDPTHADLFHEYASLKRELSTRIFHATLAYTLAKDDIVDRILTRAGWSAEELNSRRGLFEWKNAPDELPY